MSVRITRVKWITRYCNFIESDPHYEELYDLEGDPQEENNLASLPGHADQLAALRERSRVWTENLEAWKPDEAWQEPS